MLFTRKYGVEAENNQRSMRVDVTESAQCSSANDLWLEVVGFVLLCSQSALGH